MMFENVGVFKSNDKLKDTIEQIKNIKDTLNNIGISDKSKVYNTNLKEFLEFKNMVELASMITKSALNNQVNSGAHFIV